MKVQSHNCYFSLQSTMVIPKYVQKSKPKYALLFLIICEKTRWEHKLIEDLWKWNVSTKVSQFYISKIYNL